MNNQATCPHKNNIWQAIPIGDTKTELFGVRCNDCGLFIACQHVGGKADEVEHLVLEISSDIEDRLSDLLTEKFDGMRSELATLTKDAKMLALEKLIKSLSEKFVALEEWTVDKVKNQNPTEKALEKQFTSFLNTIKDVADKHFAPPRSATRRKRPLTNSPKSRSKKRS